MAKSNWVDILGWSEDQLDELRLAGFSFLREGHYKKALLFFEALVILNPKSQYDIQTLGALYLELNETEKALQTLEQALTLNPAHEPTLLNKVKALLIANKRSEALELANALATSINPSIANDASALILAYS